jgi:uncharacterized alkaline shock family protein YloU
MSDPIRPPGKTTIAPDVLVSIARLTTLGVPGVSRLTVVPSDVNSIFHRGNSQGVRISVINDAVYVDLYVVMNREVNVRDVSRTIQSQVARAISEMVGMEVGKINVHIEDIEISTKTES